MRRKARRKSKTPVLILSIVGSLLLTAVCVGGYFALKRGGKAPDGAPALFTSGDGKDSAASGDGAAAQKAGWVEVTDSEKQGYKAWMPQKPNYSPRPLGPIMGPLPGLIDSEFYYIEEKSRDTYFAGCRRLDWVAPRAERQQLIRQIATDRREAAGRETAYNITFGEITDFTQDGFPGCEIKFTGQPAITGAVRFVHAGDRLFYLFVGGPSVAQDSKLNLFVNSLKVTHRPDEEGEDTQVASKTNKSKITWDPEWLPVADADGFEALMPGKATRSGTTWTWSRSGEIFTVAYHPGKSVDDVLKGLDEFPYPKSRSFGVKRRSVTEGAAEWTPFPVRVSRYNASEGGVAEVRVYSARDRTYSVGVGVNVSSFPKHVHFFRSIKFAGQPNSPFKPKK